MLNCISSQFGCFVECNDDLPRSGIAWTRGSQRIVKDRLHEAVDRLEQCGAAVSATGYASLLQQCSKQKALEEGKRIHTLIINGGYDGLTFLGNHLMQMYAKCGRIEDVLVVFSKINKQNVVSWTIMISAYAQNGHLQEAKDTFDSMPKRSSIAWNAMMTAYAQKGLLEDARRIFDDMPQRVLISWNGIVAAYAQNGHAKEALQLFGFMNVEGMKPDEITFITVLDACDGPEFLAEGKVIHAIIISSGFESVIKVGNALVNMYGKCGSLCEARGLFDKMPQKDVVSWTAMIAILAKYGCVEDARSIFDEMPEKNVFSWNAMVAAYAHNGRMQDARHLFQRIPQKDVVSWNTLITAYAQSGHSKEALEVFHKMQEKMSKPNIITFISVINACASLSSLEEGRAIHESVASAGLETETRIGNTLVNMYGKCQSLEDAKRVFDNLQQRNVLSWTALITAYAQNGHGKEALRMFQGMDLDGIQPNEVTFVSLLDACASVTALEEGRNIHGIIKRSCFDSNMLVATALLHMYGKCGSLNDAQLIFDKMPERNLVSWTAMIAAYAQNGHGKEALDIFLLMALEGLAVDEVTFIAVLSACSHAGLLHDGLVYFVSLAGDYNVVPKVDHYMCMADLLGRVGLLNEAEELMKTMPVKPDASGWISLLGACATHVDKSRGARAAEQALVSNPKSPAPYVLLSNVYESLLAQQKGI